MCGESSVGEYSRFLLRGTLLLQLLVLLTLTFLNTFQPPDCHEDISFSLLISKLKVADIY